MAIQLREQDGALQSMAAEVSEAKVGRPRSHRVGVLD